MPLGALPRFYDVSALRGRQEGRRRGKKNGATWAPEGRALGRKNALPAHRFFHIRVGLPIVAELRYRVLYKRTVLIMEHEAWIRVAAARLRAQWPHVADDQLADVARELWHEDRWRALPPVQAVVEWLRQGVLPESER